MNLKTTAIALTGLLLMTAEASAEMKWSTFSLSLLHGEDYEVGLPERDVLTAEHASGHSWGDNFFFIDHLTDSEDGVSNYFELSPRLSLSYLTGKELKLGFIKDFYLAGTWEGSDAFNNYLFGAGVGLDVPGFKYLNVNIYRAQNQLWEDDSQLTVTWGVPFKIGSAQFLFDGFMDHTPSVGDRATETNFTPQLKWDMGAALGMSSPFYLGLEYVYWKNKFAIDGVTEKNPNLLVKWHF